MYQFPHMVSIRSASGSNYCGGGLINKNTVLLAAHCISDAGRYHNPSTLSIQVGTNDVSSSSKGRIVGAISANVHPKWQPNPVGGKYINDYDVALLHLREDIYENGESIRYMDLDFEGIATVGNDAVISGWGYYGSSYSRDFKLRDAVIPIQKHEVCEAHGLDVTPSLMICAGDGKGKDSCAGDSGSPLVQLKGKNEIYTAKRWTCVGIVSFGTSTCGSSSAIGIYSRVSSYKDFILQHTTLPSPALESTSPLPYLDGMNLIFVNSTPDWVIRKDDQSKHLESKDESSDFELVYLILIPIILVLCLVGWMVCNVTIYLCIPSICLCGVLGCIFCGCCTFFDALLRYRQGFRRIDELEENEMENSDFHDIEYDLEENENRNNDGNDGGGDDDEEDEIGGDVTINY